MICRCMDFGGPLPLYTISQAVVIVLSYIIAQCQTLIHSPKIRYPISQKLDGTKHNYPNINLYCVCPADLRQLIKHFIFVHLKFIWTCKQSLCLVRWISITGGKFVGVAQVAEGFIVLVALVSNAQVTFFSENRATRRIEAAHGVSIVCVDFHLVRLVVTVLQRKQKCLGAT